MKSIIIILTISFIACFISFCGQEKPQKPNPGTINDSVRKQVEPSGKSAQTERSTRKTKKLNDFNLKRYRIGGIYVREKFPALKIENFTVDNPRGIVKLNIPEPMMKEKIGEGKIWYGDHILLIGTIKTENLEIPEIDVERIQKIKR